MEGVEDSATVRPSADHQMIRKQATPLLAQLMHKPGDAQTKAKLGKLNDQIVEYNRENEFSAEEETMFTIDVDTFDAIFTTAGSYFARLQRVMQIRRR